jgi:hypothetical protein
LSLHLLARFLKGGDHLLAGLPSEYKEAYLAAERIIDRIGWLHMMSWMGNRNHSHILVQWLGELRAWTCIGPDSLGNKIRCVEAGLIAARNGQPFRYCGSTYTTSHEAVLQFAGKLDHHIYQVILTLPAARSTPPPATLANTGERSALGIQAQTFAVHRILLDSRIVGVDREAGPAWERFWGAYRQDPLHWNEEELHNALRLELAPLSRPRHPIGLRPNDRRNCRMYELHLTQGRSVREVFNTVNAEAMEEQWEEIAHPRSVYRIVKSYAERQTPPLPYPSRIRQSSDRHDS